MHNLFAYIRRFYYINDCVYYRIKCVKPDGSGYKVTYSAEFMYFKKIKVLFLYFKKGAKISIAVKTTQCTAG